MDLQIRMIGKFKNSNLAAVCDEYVGRIGRFYSCQIKHLRESRYSDEKKEGLRILEEEGLRLLDGLPPGACCVLLDQRGQRLDSIQFSQFLEQALNRNCRSMNFLVGGFLGVSEQVKARMDFTLSLSPMTLAHEIAVVVLMEQVYRAITILKRIPYHK